MPVDLFPEADDTPVSGRSVSPVTDLFPEADEPGIPEEVGLAESLFRRAQAGVVSQIGGLARGIGESLAPDVGQLSPKVQAVIDTMLPQRRVGAEVAAAGAKAGDLANAYREIAGGERPASLGDALANPENTARYYGGILSESLPTIGAAMLTRSPTAASTLIGAGTSGQTYGDLRAEGVPQFQALGEATTAGMMEAAGGVAPLEAAMGPGRFLPRAGRAALGEALAEAGTEGVQTATPMLTGRKDVALGEILSSMADAAIVGAPAGVAEAAIGTGLPAAEPAMAALDEDSSPLDLFPEADEGPSSAPAVEAPVAADVIPPVEDNTRFMRPPPEAVETPPVAEPTPPPIDAQVDEAVVDTVPAADAPIPAARERAERLFADYNPEAGVKALRQDEAAGLKFTENRLTRRALDDVMASPDRSVGALLETVAEQPDVDETDRWLAHKIAPLADKLGVTLADPSPEFKHAGAYDTQNNSMWIRQAKPDIILHEALHGVTSALLKNKAAANADPTLRRVHYEFDTMLSHLQSEIGFGNIDIKSAPAAVQAVLNDKQGPLANTRELLTYGMTDKPFRDWLRTLPPPPGRADVRNMWEAFKQAIMAAFGDMTPSQRSFLDALIESTGELVDFADQNPESVRSALPESARRPPATARKALPESDTLVTPNVPTAEQMKRSSRTEEVDLSRARSPQREMRFDKFDKGESPGALIGGYGDLPVAVRRRDGEYLVYDGNHRVATALSAGTKSMRMHVIDAADYDPEAAGRAPAKKSSIEEDDALLSELGVTAATKPTAPPPARPVTSTKNAVMRAEREAEGREPIAKQPVQTNEATLAAARETVADNPFAGAEVVEKLLAQGVGAISLADEAVLLVEKTNLRTKRDRAADRASDPKLTEEQRAVAKREWEDTEARINEIDQATYASGAEWGRLGQFRQRMLREDFTFEALERKERVREGRPLTAEESAKIKAMADRIATLEAEAETARKNLADAQMGQAASVTYEQLVKEMAAALKGAARQKKPSVEVLRERAAKSRAALMKAEAAAISSIDPAAIQGAEFMHLANIGALHYAEGAKTLASWTEKMRSDLGTAFDEALPAAFTAAKLQAETGAAARTAATVGETLAAIDPQKLTHKDVYDLARAHVAAGIKGENAVMKAVHESLKDTMPDLTERQVRRLFSEYGKAKFPSKAADKVELREIRALVQLQESIDRLEEGLPKLANGLQRDKATAQVKAKRARLNELLKAQEAKSVASPEKIASYQAARAENLRKQIEALDKQIFTGERPAAKKSSPTPNVEIERLKSLRDSLKADRDLIDKGPPKTADQRYQATRAKSIAKQLADIKSRIEANNYERVVKPPPKELDEANKQAQFELHKAKEAFLRHQFESEMAKRPPLKKIFGGVRESLNLARAIMTSVDLSAVLRQGGFISVGNPIRAASSIGPMLKAFRSEANQLATKQEIASRPNAPLYKKSGLELTEEGGYSLAKMEEAFMSRWIEHLPKAIGGGLIRGSQRAFVTFLNKLRADSFDAMLASLARNGEKPTDAEIKAIANYINVATGRGKIGVTNNAAVGLNTVFFAPKLVASRFNLLGGQPMYGGTARTRALIAAEYARYLAGVSVVIGLGYLAHLATGDDDDKPFISFDPRSADFMKMRFGKTYIDPLSGLAQVTTFLGRIVSGESVTGSGAVRPLRKEYKLANLFRDEPNYDKPGFGGGNAFDVTARFARTKLSPVFGAIVNTATGEDVVGNPVTPGSTIKSLVTPLSLQNVKDVMTEHGVPAGAAITSLELLGMGVQYRDPAKMDAPDYGAMTSEQRKVYGDYITGAKALKAKQDAIQQFANKLPKDMAAADLKLAVSDEAERIGLPGVTVDTYKPNTTSRDKETGARMRGAKRNDAGGVRLNTDEAWDLVQLRATEKQVSEIERRIEAINEGMVTKFSLEKMPTSYTSEDLTSGDPMDMATDEERGKALKVLQAERAYQQGLFLKNTATPDK